MNFFKNFLIACCTLFMLFEFSMAVKYSANTTVTGYSIVKNGEIIINIAFKGKWSQRH